MGHSTLLASYSLTFTEKKIKMQAEGSENKARRLTAHEPYRVRRTLDPKSATGRYRHRGASMNPSKIAHSPTPCTFGAEA